MYKASVGYWDQTLKCPASIELAYWDLRVLLAMVECECNRLLAAGYREFKVMIKREA